MHEVQSGWGSESNQPPSPNHVPVFFLHLFFPRLSLFSEALLPAPHLEALRCQNYFISMSAFTTSEGGMQGAMYESLIRPNYESWLRLLISQASTSAGEGGSDGEDSRRERRQREGVSREERMCQGGRGSGKTANWKRSKCIYVYMKTFFFLVKSEAWIRT